MLASVGRVWPAVGVILVGAALVGGALEVPAAAAKVTPAGVFHPTARHAAADPTLTILTGGDRLTSGTGSLGGTVGGVDGVTYLVTNNPGTPAFSGSCTSGENGNPSGQCGVDVPNAGSYTITQESAPTGRSVAQDNYRISEVLGVGTAGGTITVERYNTLSVTIPATGLTVPVGSTALTPNTARSGRWAVSRYNPPPPASCTRSVALLLDLSASVTTADLAAYKRSAIDFVQSLLGTSTQVTLYTFGTTSPAPGAGNGRFGPENTLDSDGVSALVNRINGFTLPGTAQFTNWDAGIWAMANSGTHYDEALVLTDGDPTAIGSTGAPDATGTATARFRTVENGIFSANRLKEEGTRTIAVGVASHAQSGSIDNLKAISGPEEGSDYFIVPFDSLEGLLTDVALAHCATLSITKTGRPATYDHVGQAITYAYTVTNTSPEDGFTLHDITVHDDLLGVITDCAERTLAPDQSTTCTATHRITQDDLDAGHVINTAHATGETPNNDTVESPPDEEIVTAEQNAAIRVTKEATPQTYDAPGQTIRYAYTVTNTGNVTLTGVTLTDDRATGISCTPSTPATLDPGDVMHCTATSTTTQADVNAGSIPNTATATGHPPNNKPPVTGEADKKVFAQRRTSIEITKSHAPETFSGAGQTIDYTYVITNTGNVPLANLRLTDNKVPGPFTCAPVDLGETLVPGQTTRCTATYTIAAADVATGFVENSATTTGTPPGGLQQPEDEDSNLVPRTVSGLTEGITLAKNARPQTYTAPGQTITYTYVITNIGNVPLMNVQLKDDRIPGPFTCSPVAIGGTLAPEESTTCTATHVTTQADVDAGSIVNTAFAEGTPPTGPTRVSPPAEEVVTGELTPAIEITKTASPRAYDKPGQRITYSYVVTNTGNMILDNVTVSDSRITGLTCRPPEGSTLAPGAVMRCTATQVITQADVDAGSVPNVATAAAHAPTGPEVSDKADEKVTAGVAPALTIAKSASPTVFTMHGQVITYKYVVTNIGNVTLRNITVTDTRYGRITCPKTALAPRASMTCRTTHAITAVDLSEGSIFNSSRAVGHPPTGDSVKSPPAHAIVTGVLAKPELPQVPVTG